MPGARLVRHQGAGVSPLTPGFAAACDPALDPAARQLYFSGRREAAANWQIWRLDLGGGEAEPVTAGGGDKRRPVVLPDGGIAFVDGGELVRTGGAGGDAQLTYSGGRVQAATVLPDGRLLVTIGDGGGARLFVMQPDGTWMTPWPGGEEVGPAATPSAGAAGLIWVAASRGATGGGLHRGSLLDPFAAGEAIGPQTGWELRDPSPLADRRLLVAARRANPHPAGTFGLFEMATAAGTRPVPVAVERRAHLLQPVAVVPRPPAPVLPSIVKTEMATGWLLVFDLARTDDPGLAALDRGSIAALRVLDRSGGGRRELARAVPAADGSVFLELPADRGLSLELVDSGGGALATMETSFWLRPNERRVCLGCHVSPAYAPPNVRPMALHQPPIAVEGPEDGPPSSRD